jgi:hypothetical protein
MHLMWFNLGIVLKKKLVVDNVGLRVKYYGFKMP